MITIILGILLIFLSVFLFWMTDFVAEQIEKTASFKEFGAMAMTVGLVIYWMVSTMVFVLGVTLIVFC
jgi:hypothetical protein